MDAPIRPTTCQKTATLVAVLFAPSSRGRRIHNGAFPNIVKILVTYSFNRRTDRGKEYTRASAITRVVSLDAFRSIMHRELAFAQIHWNARKTLGRGKCSRECL